MKHEQDDGGDAPEVCKDFLRNVCNRGNKCKFYHPPSIAEGHPPKNEYQFCHDFQNRGCKRENCRFVHCSRDVEDDYKHGGRMSEELALAILVSGQATSDDINGVPVCKDFLVGKCDRAKRCRYWHIDIDEKNLKTSGNAVGGGRAPPSHYRHSSRHDVYDDYNRRDLSPGIASYYARSFYDGISAPGGMRKRPRYDEDLIGYNSIDYTSDYPDAARMRPPSPLSYASLHEENSSLRKRVDVLKKQVSDLTAANEVLLEQNARLRAKQTIIAPQGGDASIVASMTAAAQSLNALQYVTAPSAAQAIQNNNTDALAAAAVAVSLAQAARQSLALTMSAPSSAAPSALVSYPATYARQDGNGQ